MKVLKCRVSILIGFSGAIFYFDQVEGNHHGWVSATFIPTRYDTCWKFPTQNRTKKVRVINFSIVHIVKRIIFPTIFSTSDHVVCTLYYWWCHLSLQANISSFKIELSTFVIYIVLIATLLWCFYSFFHVGAWYVDKIYQYDFWTALKSLYKLRQRARLKWTIMFNPSIPQVVGFH